MKLNIVGKVKPLLKPIKPDWRRIAIFIVLFLVLPQKASDEFVFFGGVFIIKSLFEAHPPSLDITVAVISLIASYLLACLLVWFYDTKFNKFIVSEGEVEVQPPEEKKEEKTEKKQEEEPKAPEEGEK
jgi:CDP-diglyceride synthetase